MTFLELAVSIARQNRDYLDTSKYMCSSGVDDVGWGTRFNCSEKQYSWLKSLIKDVDTWNGRYCVIGNKMITLSDAKRFTGSQAHWEKTGRGYIKIKRFKPNK